MERSHLVRRSVAVGLLLVGAATAAPAHAATTTTPTIATTTSPGGPVGTTITDQAILAGGSTTPAAPTGTITFLVYDNDCRTVLNSSSVSVNGNGTYPSGPYTPTGAGTYQFVASYSGDTNNNPVASKCGTEPVAITTAIPGGPPCTPGTPNVEGNGNQSDTYGNVGNGNQGNCNVGDGNEGDLGEGSGSASNPPEDE